jgi:hypothetical protein
LAEVRWLSSSEELLQEAILELEAGAQAKSISNRRSYWEQEPAARETPGVLKLLDHLDRGRQVLAQGHLPQGAEESIHRYLKQTKAVENQQGTRLPWLSEFLYVIIRTGWVYDAIQGELLSEPVEFTALLLRSLSRDELASRAPANQSEPS